MRNLITNLVLGIYFKLMKGEQEMMAMLFACRVVEDRTPFEKVPAKLKQRVADIIINDFGLPEIIPVEYGGTLSSEA